MSQRVLLTLLLCCVAAPLHGDDDLPGGGQATPVDSISLPAGFRAQLLRSAGKGEGSWISMTFDNRGRIVLGRDKRGVVRLSLNDERDSVDHFEVIDNKLQHCRGILWAHDSLYVCATNASGLFRLRDNNGDDQFDSVQEMKSFDYKSRYGHGPNQVVLGPDDMLYIVNGNDVAFPEGFAVDSPYRNPQDDHLLPEPRDSVEDIRVGHIVKTDPDGTNWEIVAGGFRNQFDVAFNNEGEMFTYDADMEWDVGLPWYRPTRLNHVVSGGEYGWRWGTGKWPEYFADSLPTTLDTGLGSPTGMEFGTRSKFPPGYRDSLFMGDWQHGRIFQVQLTPRGASYGGEYKVFLEGGALNVCDLTFGPDGAMYFITGGRGSQSGLYRVTYDGPEVAKESLTAEQTQQAQEAVAAREVRHQLEQFHRRRDSKAVDVAWPLLNSNDRWLRFAARLAVERQYPALWRERALRESQPRASIAALLALAHLGRAEDQSDLLAALNRLPLKTLDREQLLDALRLWQLSFIRQSKPSEANKARALSQLDSLYPHTSTYVNRELCQLLIYLQAPNVVPRTVELIRTAISQEDAIYYSQRLARVSEGWTVETRETFFDALLAARRYQGGNLLDASLQHIREDAIAKLTDAEKKHLKPRLEQLAVASEEADVPELPPAAFVKQWTWEELEAELPRTRHGRSWEQGRAVLAKAQCVKCHRVSEQGSSTGPDLTHVGRRFDERALLESIVHPSKVIDEKYRLSNYVMDSGKVVTGRPVGVSAIMITVQPDLLSAETVALKREEIEQTSPASLSPMPAGLVNVLTLDEILDVIAFLKSGGDPHAAAYKARP
ncbi:putative membrane-bound dehydrogenase domain protein [Fuerstiella marisgermanici]|uniref:Putative membrane-bound dehydrogenase domain protein n=1 Tax=Fuerstiella marisgermanici TaxID=1891926 RepID=A0A1P8WCU9_9PLAN|nr:putative membrane-bound dehydrogenase domain protein [Fuerstiella marisgermanici]